MRKNLKNYFLFILIISAQILLAQDRDAFQPDSIYKANKVKHCQVLGSNGYHHSNTYFDAGGRIVRLVKSDNLDLNKFDRYYTEINTYYFYSDEGKLVNMIDSVKTRMPTEEESESMKKTGLIATSFLDKLSQFPPLEINTYELIYDNDELVLFKKYDPKEALLFVDSISVSGNLHKKYQYIDQTLNRIEFTSYSLSGYPRTRLIQEMDGAYWYESKYEFTYEYEEKTLRLVTGERHDGETAETRYFYDVNGLVTKRQTGLYGTDQFFEEFYTYEYYE